MTFIAITKADDKPACQDDDHDPELWFPLTPQMAEEAKAICRGCEFRRACLDYALTYGVVGIWAATNEDDRDAIREKRGLSKIPIGRGAIR